MIKVMQIFGVLSPLLCVVTMFLLFFGLEIIGDIVFALSLISMIIGLVFSLGELFMSITALNLRLSDLQGTIREEYFPRCLNLHDRVR